MNPGLGLAIGVLIDIHVVIHADDAPRDTGPEFGKAGPFGLLVVVLLLLSVFFLVRSMNRHLKKLPESFDRQNPAPDQAADHGTVGIGDSDEAADDAPDEGGAAGGRRARPHDEPESNGTADEPD